MQARRRGIKSGPVHGPEIPAQRSHLGTLCPLSSSEQLVAAFAFSPRLSRIPWLPRGQGQGQLSLLGPRSSWSWSSPPRAPPQSCNAPMHNDSRCQRQLRRQGSGGTERGRLFSWGALVWRRQRGCGELSEELGLKCSMLAGSANMEAQTPGSHLLPGWIIRVCL